jgi:hypothetical protein
MAPTATAYITKTVPVGSSDLEERRGSIASAPLALTDDQLEIVLHAAEPLQPRDRAAFAAAVAQVLAGQAVLGDGIVSRTCRELQRRFMTSPPDVPRHAPRWSSRRRNGVRASAEG